MEISGRLLEEPTDRGRWVSCSVPLRNPNLAPCYGAAQAATVSFNPIPLQTQQTVGPPPKQGDGPTVGVGVP